MYTFLRFIRARIYILQCAFIDNFELGKKNVFMNTFGEKNYAVAVTDYKDENE